MGQTVTIRCPKCGKRYDWRVGGGFLQVETLHCDRCGKEKRRKLSDAWGPEDRECRCGGVFLEDAPVRCPKCGTVVEEIEEHLEGVMCWD